MAALTTAVLSKNIVSALKLPIDCAFAFLYGVRLRLFAIENVAENRGMKSKQNIHFLNEITRNRRECSLPSEIIAKIMCENQSLKKTIGNSKEFLNSSGVRVAANGLQSNFLKTKFSAHELWRQKVSYFNLGFGTTQL